jgi:hypothetical protein
VYDTSEKKSNFKFFEAVLKNNQ